MVKVIFIDISGRTVSTHLMCNIVKANIVTVYCGLPVRQQGYRALILDYVVTGLLVISSQYEFSSVKLNYQ